MPERTHTQKLLHFGPVLIGLQRKRLPNIGAEWYDGIYGSLKRNYVCHYTQSSYYFIWTVIADRVHGAGAIFDVGCGTGQLAHLLHDRHIESNRARFAYLGFDFSNQAITIARERLPEVSFQVDDALTTNLFGDAEYDTVIMTEVLEHIGEDIQVLSSVRPGARVLATVPNFLTTSHVRRFVSAEEVNERYGFLFDGLRVDGFRMTEEGKILFLLDGRRT